MMQHPRPITQLRLGAIALAIGSLAAHSAQASPLFVGGGFDYYAGPGSQTTKSAVATAGANLLVASFSLTGMRFDDEFIGKGNAVTGGVGFSVFPMTSLRFSGTRYISDETYRAWRVKVGPQFGLPTGQRVGLYYSHYADNGDVTSDGASAEIDVPLIAGWSGRGAATYATSQGVRSSEGSVGLSWRPVHMLEISTDLGLARNGGASSTQPFPSRSALLLPLLGGGGSTSSGDPVSNTEATILAGMRVWFP